jgi:O-antigen ligase
MNLRVSPRTATAGPPGYQIAYALFLVMNVLLFLRPSDLFPSLAQAGLYEMAIIGCFLAAFPAVLEQFSWASLSVRPITLCVLGFGVALTISEGLHKTPDEAFDIVFQYAKIVVYYLLFVATVRTAGRLSRLLYLITGLICVITFLAVLQFHGLIDMPALAPVIDRDTDVAQAQVTEFPRLRGPGIFNDPNDLGQLLAVAMILCLWAFGERRFGILAWLWLAPLGFLGYGLLLTQSRGAFIALVGGMVAFLYARFGLWRTVGLGLLGVPALFVLFSGRMTEISPSGSTGLQRVQIWSDGIEMFREDPILGVGVGEYNRRAGYVAHNSFLHCFAEVGFVGGACFLGAFFLTFWSLARLRPSKTTLLDPELQRLLPYLLGVMGAYAAGLLTLSRAYVVPTYLFLGLVTVFIPLAQSDPPVPPLRAGFKTLFWIVIASAAYLLLTFVFVSVFVRWG